MRLTNEFVVAAPPEVVWSHLVDMEKVAQCVPGAKVEEVVPPDTYKGKVRLKIGPMTVEYRGQVTLIEVDEVGREATIQMKAREARGQGSALATVRNRLMEVPEGTRVVAETDLEITGPQAQFGKGVLEDVGGRILEEFTTRLERQILEESSAKPGATPSAGSGALGTRTNEQATVTTTPDDALDLNRMIGASLRERGRKVGALAAALALVTLVVWCRRKRGRRLRVGP